MKLFAFAASLRKASVNKQLIHLAVERARAQGAEVTLVDFAQIICPNYNFDDQQESGFPEAAEHLKSLLESHDGFMISSPEYNYAVPGNLKNALDWCSRYKPAPTAGKHAYLLSASPSLVGGNRGLWSLRQPLEVMSTYVYPGMFSLASAHEAFTEDGQLKDQALQGRLDAELGQFIAHASR